MSNQNKSWNRVQSKINDEQLTWMSPEPAVATTTALCPESWLPQKAAAQAEKDRALRIAAEMENPAPSFGAGCRKGSKFASKSFSGELLPVIDSLERALERPIAKTKRPQADDGRGRVDLRAMLTTVGKVRCRADEPHGDAI